MSPSSTKQQLVMQALVYFTEHDYESSSLNDIASNLGVTKGAIYHHFSGKDDLFKAAVLMLIDSLSELIMEQSNSVESVEMYLKKLFRMEELMDEIKEVHPALNILADYGKLIYMLVTGIKKFPEIKDHLKNVYNSFIRDLVLLLNRGAQSGELRQGLDYEAIAFEMTAFYEGTLLLHSITGENSYVQLAPRVCDEIWSRIRSEE